MICKVNLNEIYTGSNLQYQNIHYLDYIDQGQLVVAIKKRKDLKFTQIGTNPFSSAIVCPAGLSTKSMNS